MKTGTIMDYAQGLPEGASAAGHVAPGFPAEHPLGVSYLARWERPGDGFSLHSRRSARALAMTGCPVRLRSITPSELPSDPDGVAVQKTVLDLLNTSIARSSVEILQVVPGNGELIYRIMHHPRLTQRENEIVNKSRVIYTVWERTPAPKPIVDCLNMAGQAWVACHKDAAMLAASGVSEKLIRVVPMPYMSDDPHLAIRNRHGRHSGPVRFYHIGKWEPRKAQHEMIGAFLCAMKPGEAELHMKTSKAVDGMIDYPAGPKESVFMWLKNHDVYANGWNDNNIRDSVKIYSGRLPEDQLVALHARSDVYLSLSRGEGWDIPAFDAKICGNLICHTWSGGPIDFRDLYHDISVVSDKSADCHPCYGWPKGSTYLGLDHDASVIGIKAAATVAEAGRNSREYDMSYFRADNVGKMMLDNLRELVGAEGKLY